MTMQNRIAVTTNTYHGKSLDEALEKIQIDHEVTRVRYLSSRRATLSTSPSSMKSGT